MRKDVNKQELLQDYIDNLGLTYIIKKYKVSSAFVYNLLHKYNIPHQSKQSGLTLKTLDGDAVLKLYKDGQSASSVANKFGCSHTLILKFLNVNNVVKTPKNQFIRKYKMIKEDYFDIIDTEEKAYYLGLLFADGCVYVRNSYTASINLQECDKEILEKFSIAVLGEIVLKYRDLSKYNNKNQWVLRFNSKKICKQLEKLGCVQAKSLILKWPTWLVDLELQRHFIRGYFDGDGSICCNINNYHSYKFSIISTLDFCLNVDNAINQQLPIHFTYGVHNNNITRIISVNGNRQILRLMDWLYKDASFYFQRKYDKYLQLKARITEVDVKKLSA